MDADTFANAYMARVLHLSNRDPVLAEYYLAHFPPFLEMAHQVLVQVKRNTNRWLKTAAATGITQPMTAQTSVPWDRFADAVYALATIYTYGSNHFPRNANRANKFIRILKRMNDDRYNALQKENNQRKRKSLQQ